MSQSVCRDFVSNGFCRYGDRCKFYHPPKNGARSFSSSTPLGKQGLKYQFNEETVRAELRDELPQWTLSSFGVGKYEPSLFSGSDVSPEELKWKSVQALASTNPQRYIQEENTLTSQAKSTISTALQNLQTTLKLAEKLHDARYPPGAALGDPRPAGFSEDAILAGGSSSSGGAGFKSSASAFGQSAFGTSGNTHTGPKATSAFGSSSPAFGSSSFGQKPSTSAFGSTAFGTSQPAQSSAFGKSAFGSSSFGQSTSPSAFGTSSTPQSAFGTSSTPQSAFGASSTPQSAFGAAPQTAFGATSVPQSAFGAPSPQSAFSAPSPQSAFGATSTPQFAFGTSAPQSAFGQSGFGAKPPGTFGSTAPSAFASTSSPSAFGSSPFGASSTPSALGAPATSPSAQPPSAPSTGAGFGQSSQPSGFGAFSQTPPGSTSAFGAAPSSAFSGFGAPSTAFGQASSSAFSSSAFNSGFNSTPSTKPTPSFLDVNVPDGWSYDDPWSHLLPTVDGTGPGKLNEADAVAFQTSSFRFDNIPILPPPVSLRG